MFVLLLPEADLMPNTRRSLALTGNKTRVLFYGIQIRFTLNKYCKVRGSNPPNTLFESYKEIGKPLTEKGVQYIVRQLVKRSGIKKKISPHSFRHTFAVHYLNRGGSIFQLQKLGSLKK
jgi:integrase/recombinase XerC